MNSIRVARARPRRRSVNFRTFAWLLHRVACWRILFGDVEPRFVAGTAARFADRPRGLVEHQALVKLARERALRWRA